MPGSGLGQLRTSIGVRLGEPLAARPFRITGRRTADDEADAPDAVLTLSVLFGSTGLDAQPVDPATSKSLSSSAAPAGCRSGTTIRFWGDGVLVSGGVSKPLGHPSRRRGRSRLGQSSPGCRLPERRRHAADRYCAHLLRVPVCSGPRAAVRRRRTERLSLDGLPDDALRGSWPGPGPRFPGRRSGETGRLRIQRSSSAPVSSSTPGECVRSPGISLDVGQLDARAAFAARTAALDAASRRDDRMEGAPRVKDVSSGPRGNR